MDCRGAHLLPSISSARKDVMFWIVSDLVCGQSVMHASQESWTHRCCRCSRQPRS